MKQRAQHIAVVLAVSPILYVLDRLTQRAGSTREPFRKFLWACMWEDNIG